MKKNALSLIKSSTLILVFIFFAVHVYAGVQATYYVSPSGRDADPGSLSQPFATITKARDIVRAINGNMTGDIVINLMDGTYELASTFTLSATDKGTNGHNIIYQAYRCETPVISGGIKITNWTIHDAVKNIYKATVGTSIDTRQLYVNGLRATRARSDDAAGWAESGNGYNCPTAVASWGNISNVEVVSRKLWKCHRGPIASVSGTHAVMAQPYWNNLHAQFDAPPYWIENAYELLDTEGEWYLDRTAGVLYYRPRAGESMTTTEVILPKLEMLVSGSGVSNVQFKGITFSHVTWLYPNFGMGFACAQSEAMWTVPGWTGWKQLPGNVAFDHCSNMRFENNTFEHLGVTGLQLYTGCSNNIIYDNIFRDISGSAISIGNMDGFVTPTPAAGDEVKDNIVDNNFITKTGVEYEGCVGIFVGYTEHTILTHNELRSLPYTGISVGWGWNTNIISGRNNEISYNYIDSVMTVLFDGGGIYTLSAQPGAEVHHNFLNHQFHDYGSLYLDNGSTNMHWHHNVVAHSIRWLLTQADDYTNLIDYNYSDNSTQVANCTTCTMQNNTFISGSNWPSAAITIADSAGRRGVSKPPLTIINLALNKISSCSSTAASIYPASNATDGVSTTIWASDGVETNPWWQVDLGAGYKVAQVKLTARQDIDQPIARTDFEIWGSNASNFSSYTLLGSKTGAAFPAYGTWTLNVPTPASYRYIRVQRINNGGHFNFSEFLVFDSTAVFSSNVLVKNVCVNPTSVLLSVGGASQLTPTILPANASNTNVSWSSSNNAVATVSSSGLVTANTVGQTTITATTQDGNKTDTSIVTVNTATGITSYDKNVLEVFPNPFSDYTTIQLNSSIINAELNIYDVYGQKIRMVNNITGDQLKIERGDLNSGIYFYELKQDDKNIATGKLVITD